MSEKFILHRINQNKRDGSVKERVVLEPTEETRRIHNEMLRLLHSLDFLSPHATGSIPGKTLLDNIRPHQHSDYFYLLDLKDAYQHVDIEQLLGILSPPRIPSRHAND